MKNYPSLLIKNLFLFFVVLIFQVTAATVSAELAEPMIPFWGSNRIINESLLLIPNNAGTPEASLLFPATSIISVKNSALNVTYQQGVDWSYQNGKIRSLPGSGMPYLNNSDLVPVAVKFLHPNQISVTYTHNSTWTGPVPTYAGTVKLPHVVGKLSRNEPISVVFYGDSITVGGDMSGLSGVPPNLPVWSQLIINKWRDIFTSNIAYFNTAVGGTTSVWGIENVSERVNSHHPDLVIIGFGMNERTSPATQYRNNLQTIINNVKTANPNAEFILIASMLPNPVLNSNGNLQQFRTEIQNMIQTGIIMADMTGVHMKLLEIKKYTDLSGNNINHANDFLGRWYGQEIAGILTPPVIGFLDSADCNSVSGWAGITNSPGKTAKVKLYADGYSASNLIGAYDANHLREAAVCNALGITQTPCTHGFAIPLPASLKNGQSHLLDVYVTDMDARDVKLSQSGKTVTCNPNSLTGDVNNDGQVNLTDLQILFQNLGRRGQPNTLPTDINQNGLVEIFDAAVIIKQYH